MSNTFNKLSLIIFFTGLLCVISLNNTQAGVCGPPPDCGSCTSQGSCEGETGCSWTGSNCMTASPTPTPSLTPTPSPTPGPSDCCVEHGTPGCDDPTCEEIVCGLDPYCCGEGEDVVVQEEGNWDNICVNEAVAECGELCPQATPTPAPSEPGYHQIGGLAQGTPKTRTCCSFYSDVCAPCGNPAQGYSYQTPNACDDAVDYRNLWVRCQDPTCNNMTKGYYSIQLCHFNQPDPSTPGTESCTDMGDCIIGNNYGFSNHCDIDDLIAEVKEGELVYIKTIPSSRPAPNAPLKALHTALVKGCDNGYCGDNIKNGTEECDGEDVDACGRYETCAPPESPNACTCVGLP